MRNITKLRMGRVGLVLVVAVFVALISLAYLGGAKSNPRSREAKFGTGTCTKTPHPGTIAVNCNALDGLEEAGFDCSEDQTADTCSDGIDNDCDGKVDSEDEECGPCMPNGIYWLEPGQECEDIVCCNDWLCGLNKEGEGTHVICTTFKRL